MPTVIRRLRVPLENGDKISAVKQARKDAGYSLHEALRLVQHCEGYHGLTKMKRILRRVLLVVFVLGEVWLMTGFLPQRW